MNLSCQISMSKEKNILDNIRSKQSNYPDGAFFEKMAENVIAEHSSPFKKVPFYKKPIVRWVAVAAMFIPLVFLFTRNNQESSQVQLANLEVPQESIETYVEEQNETVLVFGNTNAKQHIAQLTSQVDTEIIEAYLQEEYGDWDEEEYWY